MTTSGIPVPGQIVDGKYRIERELGRGGMAVVFAATQLLARREVAIKWLLPAVARSERLVARFLQEAQAAARITHPNVVSVLDVGRSADGFYLVMELVAGETLRARIERLGLPSVAEALSIGCGVIGALHAAHRAGVVHRDVKPDNVLVRLDERGRPRGVKVLDFGISKLSESESLTLTGQYFGTAHYLAPEQAAGTDTTSPRIDVYQVGVLFYEMLTGRRPYEADTYAGILVALMTTEHVPIRALRADLPPPLAYAIERAMARDPQQRPADAFALAKLVAQVPGARFDEELERAIAESAGTEPAMHAVSAQDVAPVPTVPMLPIVPAVPTATTPDAPLPVPRSPAWPLALAVVGLGLIVAVAGFFALRTPAPSTSPVAAPPPPTPVAPTLDAALPPQDLDALPRGVALPPLPPPPPSTAPSPSPTPTPSPTPSPTPTPTPSPTPTPPPSTSAEHHHHPHVSADEF